jgi:Bacterial membrane protein YfhO
MDCGALFPPLQVEFPAVRPDVESRVTGFSELVVTSIADAKSRAELLASRARIVAAASVRLLRSGLADDGAYLGVTYGSGGGGDGQLPTVRSQAPAGAVSAERADLDDGEAAATVRMRRPGVAVLSASYDPGWTATVNGRRRPTRMVAPALVAVNVPAGTDHVVFRFHGYGDYPALLALSGLTLAMVAAAPVCVRRARRRRHAKRNAARR